MRADALLGAVVRGADEVDLAELRVDLQKPVVTVGGFDGGNERQQQILGLDLVGGERQTACPLEVGQDRHF